MPSLAEIKAAAEAARRRYDKPDLQFARATEVLLLLDAQDWLLERLEELAEALRVVSNAYGCFAGCTGSLPDAPKGHHTVACREARAALARLEGS